MELAILAQDQDTFPQHKIFVKYANEIIPAETNGRLKLKVQTGVELNVSAAEFVTAVSQGVVDLTKIGLGPASGKLPLLEGPELPGLYTGLSIDDARAATNTFRAEMDKALQEKFKVKVANFYPYPSQVLYCRDQISSLDDLRGKRVRVFSTSLADLFAALGAQTVTITSSEVYSALERGVVDCAVTGTATGNSSRWFEVSKTLYTLNLGMGLSVTGVNLDRFNSLPKDVQDYLMDVMKRIEDELWALKVNLDQDGIDCNTGKDTCKLGIKATASKSMTEVKPIPADVQKLKDTLASVVLPKWVTRCGGAVCADVFNKTIGAKLGIQVR